MGCLRFGWIGAGLRSWCRDSTRRDQCSQGCCCRSYSRPERLVAAGWPEQDRRVGRSFSPEVFWVSLSQILQKAAPCGCPYTSVLWKSWVSQVRRNTSQGQIGWNSENPEGATVVEGMFWNPPSLITFPSLLDLLFHENNLKSKATEEGGAFFPAPPPLALEE